MNQEEKLQHYKASENDKGFLQLFDSSYIPRVHHEQLMDGYIWLRAELSLLSHTYCLNSEEKIKAFKDAVGDNGFFVADVLTKDNIKALLEEGMVLLDIIGHEVEKYIRLNVGDWCVNVRPSRTVFLEATVEELQELKRNHVVKK